MAVVAAKVSRQHGAVLLLFRASATCGLRPRKIGLGKW